MNKVLLILLLIFFSTTALAQLDFCDIDKAAALEFKRLSKLQVQRSQLDIQNLNEIRELMDSRSWESGKPIVEQMSAEEASKFTELSGNSNTNSVASLLESKRERDILAFANMAEILKRYHAGFYHQAEAEDFSEREKNLLSIISLMESGMPDIPDSIYIDMEERLSQRERAVKKQCEIEDALALAANAISYQLDQKRANQAVNEIKALQKKYGSTEKDALPANEYQYFIENLKPILTQLQSDINFAQNLMRLYVLEKSSELMFESWKQDQYMKPGDFGFIGTTFQVWTETGKVSEFHRLGSGAINMLNELIPSDKTAMLNELAEAQPKDTK